MSDENDFQNDVQKYDKLEIKSKDSNQIEYLILFEAKSDNIEITCNKIDDEEIIYTTNISFLDAKNKHKYFKGAEDSEEILEALSEFIDSIKLSQEGKKMKIIFTIVYLKKKNQIVFELKKKELFSDDEEEENDENSEKKILKLQKKVEVLTSSNDELSEKVSKLTIINDDLLKKFENTENRIDNMGNFIQNLVKEIENLSNILLYNQQDEQFILKNSVTDSSKNDSETKSDSKMQSKELLFKAQMKDKIEDYNEENIITSSLYNYCFIQLKNGNIAIGYNSGTIGIYETKYFSIVNQMNIHSKDVRCILELSNGNIASCANDNNIAITKLSNDNKSYEEIQKIQNNSCVYRIIEINNYLISSNCDSIDIWLKNNNDDLYENVESIQIGKNIYNILQVNEKYFVAHIATKTLHFYDIDDFTLEKEIDNIPTRLYNNLALINEDILCIGSTEQIFLVSISNMEIIKIVNVEKCGIESLAFLPNNTLLVGATIGINNLPYYSFIQFKLNDENNDLIEISRKNQVHGWTIYDLKYVVINGQYKIASSGSMDCKIKIWS